MIFQGACKQSSFRSVPVAGGKALRTLGSVLNFHPNATEAEAFGLWGAEWLQKNEINS